MDLFKRLVTSLVLAFVITVGMNNVYPPFQYPHKVTWMGSGFFINENGYIATAAHVVTDDISSFGVVRKVTKISVYYKGSFRNAVVVAKDLDSDTAIIKLTEESGYGYLWYNNYIIKHTPYFKLEREVNGDPVHVVGFPAPDVYGLFPHIASGTSFTDFESDFISLMSPYSHLFFMHANVCHGNSGGAVINQYGNAIGVVDILLSIEKDAVCSDIGGATYTQFIEHLAHQNNIIVYEDSNIDMKPRILGLYPIIRDIISQEKVVFIVVTTT